LSECLPVLNYHREEEDGSRRSSFWPACWSCPAQGSDGLSTKGSGTGSSPGSGHRVYSPWPFVL